MTARITLDLYQHHETEGDNAAYLLGLDDDVVKARWIPKSLCKRLAAFPRC